MSKLRIATRESLLALWQANHVKKLLLDRFDGLQVELVPMTTQGDKILDTPLSLIGGKGLFIKELEQAIYQNRADIAVHCIKDMPMELPDGMAIGAILERADARDALVSNRYCSLDEMPEGSVVGTSSLRRQTQLKIERPDFVFKDLRGNINTRLKKLDAGDYDAIILAACGLQRLSLEDRISAFLDTDICLPAAGQAAIGIEYLQTNAQVLDLIQGMEHPSTRTLVECERAVAARLQASCNLPIAAYATRVGDTKTLSLTAFVSDPKGRKQLKVTREGDITEPVLLGEAVAAELLAKGAAGLLELEVSP